MQYFFVACEGVQGFRSSLLPYCSGSCKSNAMNRLGTVYDNFRKGFGGEYFIALVVSYAFTKEVYGIQICKGPSMVPTLNSHGEAVVVDIFSYKYRNLAYDVGDVVISKSKRDPKTLVCKRVTGVAGDTVLYVDYNSGKLKSNVIDRGRVWLSGDNPLQSNDSRVYGQVPVGLLIGAVKYKCWYRPLHFNHVDKIDPALASREQTPAICFAKSYNVSRGSSRFTQQEWKFLYSMLKDDERSSNLIPDQRELLLRLAESNVGAQTDNKPINSSTDLIINAAGDELAASHIEAAESPEKEHKEQSGH